MFIEIQNDKDLIQMGGFVGLAQINTTSGNLEYNSRKIIDYIKKAEDFNLDIVVFPANSLLGNLTTDFIKRYQFIIEEEKKYLEQIAKQTAKTIALVGYTDENNNSSFAVLRYGRVEKFLDQADYITSKYFNDGVEYYIRSVAIPSTSNSEYDRANNLINLAKSHKRPILEVNRVGADDCISYAGLSCAYDENGNLIARARDFEEQLLIINPLLKYGTIYNNKIESPSKDFSLDYNWDLERIYKTLVQGIRDYFSKCGLKRAVLGLSGGLDSTVSAVLLADALGKENVYGVSMPSKLTSNESKTDAQKLAENLGIGFTELSIKPMYETTDNCLKQLFNEIHKEWNCRYTNSFTPDNIQARSRAIYLWGIANEFESCIPIATSDKSELYMGYATINGDMSGGFAPIADVTKTKLFALARWMNKNREEKNTIPETVINKRPGAELAIDPNTGKTLCAEDALMPYEFMDEIIYRIEQKNQSYKELLNTEFLYEKKNTITKTQKTEWLDKFYRRMSTALYKSYIMPPYTIIDSKTINKTQYSQPITSGKINYNNLL